MVPQRVMLNSCTLSVGFKVNSSLMWSGIPEHETLESSSDRFGENHLTSPKHPSEKWTLLRKVLADSKCVKISLSESHPLPVDTQIWCAVIIPRFCSSDFHLKSSLFSLHSSCYLPKTQCFSHSSVWGIVTHWVMSLDNRFGGVIQINTVPGCKMEAESSMLFFVGIPGDFHHCCRAHLLWIEAASQNHWPVLQLPCHNIVFKGTPQQQSAPYCQWHLNKIFTL